MIQVCQQVRGRGERECQGNVCAAASLARTRYSKATLSPWGHRMRGAQSLCLLNAGHAARPVRHKSYTRVPVYYTFRSHVEIVGSRVLVQQLVKQPRQSKAQLLRKHAAAIKLFWKPRRKHLYPPRAHGTTSCPMATVWFIKNDCEWTRNREKGGMYNLRISAQG